MDQVNQAGPRKSRWLVVGDSPDTGKMTEVRERALPTFIGAARPSILGSLPAEEDRGRPDRRLCASVSDATSGISRGKIGGPADDCTQNATAGEE